MTGSAKNASHTGLRFNFRCSALIALVKDEYIFLFSFLFIINCMAAGTTYLVLLTGEQSSAGNIEDYEPHEDHTDSGQFNRCIFPVEVRDVPVDRIPFHCD